MVLSIPPKPKATVISIAARREEEMRRLQASLVSKAVTRTAKFRMVNGVKIYESMEDFGDD